MRLLLLASLLVATGCAPLGRPDRPPQHVYLLEGSQAVAALQQEHDCHVLMVSSTHSAPGFAGSAFAYRQGDARIQYFAYHRWSDSPARMLRPLLIDAAERSNVFQAVLTPAAPVEGSVRLDSDVIDLSQRFANGASDVRFAVRVHLFGEGRLLGSGVFEAIEPADPDPVSGIEAANRASARMLQGLMRFVQETVRTRSPRCPDQD